MLNFKITRAWIYMWRFVTPAMLLFALSFMIYELDALSYRDYVFPPAVGAVGWWVVHTPT
jgi:hypothetical protein